MYAVADIRNRSDKRAAGFGRPCEDYHCCSEDRVGCESDTS